MPVAITLYPQEIPSTINKAQSTVAMAVGEIGLGDQATLNKIDKLRELNVGTIIPLPQVSQTNL